VWHKCRRSRAQNSTKWTVNSYLALEI
jgi:hypothetical protein